MKLNDMIGQILAAIKVLDWGGGGSSISLPV